MKTCKKCKNYRGDFLYCDSFPQTTEKLDCFESNEIIKSEKDVDEETIEEAFEKYVNITKERKKNYVMLMSAMQYAANCQKEQEIVTLEDNITLTNKLEYCRKRLEATEELTSKMYTEEEVLKLLQKLCQDTGSSLNKESLNKWFITRKK